MKCRLCEAGPFSGPQAINQHRLAEHPADVKRAKLRKKRESRSVPPPESEHGAETDLVIAATSVFENAALDVATNARVISYLRDRYTIPETE